MIFTHFLPFCRLSFHFVDGFLHCIQAMKFNSVQFSRSGMSDFFRPHGLQDARPPCPSPTLESTQTHIHWDGDATQPSPLSSLSPPALNLSQHQGLFQWASSSHQVAKVLGVSASTSALPMNIQDWSPLGWTGWISLQSKGLSRVFSNTTVQKHQFFSAIYFFLYYFCLGRQTQNILLQFMSKSVCLHSLLGVLRFQVLHLSLESILN